MAKEAEKLEAQAARLRDLKDRVRPRVTFAQIAKATNITERQVQRWFAGESDVGATPAIGPLAKILQTTPDYIEYGDREQDEETPDLLESLNGSASEQLDRIEEELQRLRRAIAALVAGELERAARLTAPPRRRRGRGGNPPPAAG